MTLLATHRLQLFRQIAVLDDHVAITLARCARVGRQERVPVAVLGVEHGDYCRDSYERVKGCHKPTHRRHHSVDDELTVRVASISSFCECLL